MTWRKMAKTIKQLLMLLDRMDRQITSDHRDDAAVTLDEIVEAYREIVRENEKLRATLQPFAMVGSLLRRNQSLTWITALIHSDRIVVNKGYLLHHNFTDAADVLFGEMQKMGNSGD